MTKNTPISITTIFSNRYILFEFFLIYWDASSTEVYNEQDRFLKKIRAGSNLEANWKFNSWDLVELDQILSKIHEGLQELNSNIFLEKNWGTSTT